MKPEWHKYQLALSISIKSLAGNQVRAFLTALGIIFGVAAVIAMLAIGNGAKKEILEQIKLVGVNNIIVQKKLLEKSDVSEAKEQGNNYSRGLHLRDVASIKELLPGIENISPEVAYESFVIHSGNSKTLRLVGVDHSYFNMFQYDLIEGRFFEELHVKNSLPVCVIGPLAKRALFNTSSPIGKKIKCGKVWFEVIGVIKSNQSDITADNMGIRNPDQDIYIPISSLLLRYRNRNLITKKVVEAASRNNDDDDDDNQGDEKPAVDYNQLDKIIVQLKDQNQLKESANILSKHLYRRHNDIYDFEIHIPELLLKQQQKSKDIFNVVLGVIAGISLLVGGIGIMNIMLASVMERVKEIGIRIAIGAAERDIVLQFLTEALLLSLGGGIIGIFLGVFIAFLITNLTGILTIVSASSIFLSFGVSVAIGLIFGLMPARKAARQDPVESLRN